MTIGERLKSRRESLGLTLEQVGDYIGVGRATVQRYESNAIDIKRTVAIKLAEILKTTPSYIMGWDDSVPEIPTLSLEADENIKKYLLLNEEGKKRVGQLIDDLSALPKYQIRDENGLTDDQRRRFSNGMDELAQAVENICEDSQNTGSLLFGLSHGKK